MTIRRQRFGKLGESVAISFLKKNGYRILEQNYRNIFGEIDIVAMDGNTIVFVEVKARRSKQFGNPKYSVTYKKKRKISMVALDYLKKKSRMNQRARFDVISISTYSEGPQVEIVKNAFELAY